MVAVDVNAGVSIIVGVDVDWAGAAVQAAKKYKMNETVKWRSNEFNLISGSRRALYKSPLSLRAN
jgi:hypothetical protein